MATKRGRPARKARPTVDALSQGEYRRGIRTPRLRPLVKLENGHHIALLHPESLECYWRHVNRVCRLASPDVGCVGDSFDYSEVTRNKTHALLYVVHGHTVGFVILKRVASDKGSAVPVPFPSGSQSEPDWFIDTVWVHIACRLQGVASALVECALSVVGKSPAEVGWRGALSISGQRLLAKFISDSDRR